MTRAALAVAGVMGAAVMTAALGGATGLVAAADDTAHAAAIARLKTEALQRSRVMEFAEALTDTYGGRLTGSPGARAAGEYARTKLLEAGVANAHLEPWPFGPGWSNERMSLRMVTPDTAPLTAFPRAWTPSTAGPVTGEAVLVTGTSAADLEKYRGTLKGKIVLVAPNRERPDDPRPSRWSDADLQALAQPAPPGARVARITPQEQEIMNLRDRLFVEEGALAALEPSRLVRNGALLVARSGARRPSDPPMVPTVVVAIEQYGRITRLLQRGVPVRLEIDVRNRTHTETTDSFNVIGEIPGTDAGGEVVMLGAHLDGWHSGTAATDNAAGCAVMMEAMRVLKAAGVPLERTVRIALWTGEEQGTLGSRAYVQQHIGDRATMTLAAEHPRVSLYLNLDAGTGAIRGIFLQGNESARPAFQRWLAPLADLGAGSISIRNSGPGGSDHAAFNDIGVPGFQFIQDPSDYEDRAHTHHTSVDVFEALDADALRKNAAIVAIVAYQAANDDGMVPRMPLPSPPAPRD